jgi:hypothetical protein
MAGAGAGGLKAETADNAGIPEDKRSRGSAIGSNVV